MVNVSRKRNVIADLTRKASPSPALCNGGRLVGWLTRNDRRFSVLSEHPNARHLY